MRKNNDSLIEIEKVIKKINLSTDRITAKQMIGGHINSFLRKGMIDEAAIIKKIAKMI